MPLATSSETISSGSSTIGFCVIHDEFDRVGARDLDVDSATGGSTDSVELLLLLCAIVSFLRMNHSPELLPWTLIVSFLSESMSPTDADRLKLAKDPDN